MSKRAKAGEIDEEEKEEMLTSIKDATKGKSMVEEKREKLERKRQARMAKINLAALGDFIRLVDYVSLVTYCQLANSSIEFMVSSLTRVTKSGLIETLVDFDPMAQFVVDEKATAAARGKEMRKRKAARARQLKEAEAAGISSCSAFF